MNADEPIAVSQAEWDEVHECTFCSECELMVGCQTEPNFGCQVEEKKRRITCSGCGVCCLHIQDNVPDHPGGPTSIHPAGPDAASRASDGSPD